MKRLLRTYIYRTFCSRRFLCQAIVTALMAITGAVLLQQMSVMALNGELPKSTLSSLRAENSYKLGIAAFGSVMQLRLLRTKDFITGLLCTEGMLTLIAVLCVRNTTGELRYGGAANAVSRGYGRSQVFFAMCITNVLLTLSVSLVCLLSFAVFTQLPVSGFNSGGIADIEDVGVIMRQLVELTSFAVFSTAVSVMLKKPLRSALTLLSAVMVLPTAFGYMRIMYGTDFGLPKIISFIRLLHSGMLLPNIADAAAAAAMTLCSCLAGIYLIKKIRIDT